MTRAEAIEKLKRWKLEVDDEKDYAEYLEGWFYKDDEIAFDMAIEALKFRGAYEIAVKAANKAFENRWTQWVEWIPCSDEKLPQEYENVLVTDENGKVLMAYYIQDMSEAMSIDWYDVKGWVIKPTAWMQLPTPFPDPTPDRTETET